MADSYAPRIDYTAPGNLVERWKTPEPGSLIDVIGTTFSSLVPNLGLASSVNEIKERSVRVIDLESRLQSFLDLAPGWDGYSASSVDKGIASKVRSLVDADTDLPDRVFPTPDGTIQLEYDCESGSIELEVLADHVSVLIERADGSLEESTAPDLLSALDQVARG